MAKWRLKASVIYLFPIFCPMAVAIVNSPSQVGLIKQNRNSKYWDRSNYCDHIASRGKVLATIIPVFHLFPVINRATQDWRITASKQADDLSVSCLLASVVMCRYLNVVCSDIGR
jgi:hypothetical protein